jgi:hypothetical protein
MDQTAIIGRCARWVLLSALVVGAANVSATEAPARGGSYADLLTLFSDWRAFERPPLRDGAPDYTAGTIARKQVELKNYQARLAALDSSRWPVEQQVDYRLVWAEMNGLDFEIRVLQPWARDPAFYNSVRMEQSDTPAHEGPTHHALVEIWTYSFPLNAGAETKLTAELRTVAPLLTQARLNLTGNARDLWVSGAGTMRQQAADLTGLAVKTTKANPELKRAVAAALRATTEFADWLDAQAPSKTGPSGVGKENYTWSLRNVHLVPLSWEEEVSILKRELARAHASLKLEEQHNIGLPPLAVISSPEEYQRRANEAVTKYMAFLKDRDILTVKDYMDPAMRAHIGEYSPIETRNFFAIASHNEPLSLFTHFYHWFDNARIALEPHLSPIRRAALLYNIWDSRAEGMATAVEELMMHAGLYDDNPRAREVMWIMLAQRCARGLASLHAQANEFDMREAKDFQVQWTPRGWMRPDLDLLGFEQQLYLRQPGYGTSYVTGKYLIDELIMDRARQLGGKFTLRGFLDEFNAAGVIPVSMIRWQLTGNDDEVRALTRAQ